MPEASVPTASRIAALTAGRVGKDNSFEASLIDPGTVRPGAYAGSDSSAGRIWTVMVTSLLMSTCASRQCLTTRKDCNRRRDRCRATHAAGAVRLTRPRPSARVGKLHEDHDASPAAY